MTLLPVNIDASYLDNISDPSVKIHQQHHDTIHGALNGLPPTIQSNLSWINVKDAPYNAVGNGVADDTAAIQAAYNALGGAGTLFFPEGIYKITAPIQVGQLTSFSVELRGAYAANGGANSVIGTRILQATASANIINHTADTTQGNSLVIRDMQLSHAAAGATGNGLVTNPTGWTGGITLDNVMMQWSNTAVVINSIVSPIFRNCTFIGNTTSAVDLNLANLPTFENCYFQASSKNGLRIRGLIYDLRCTSCVFESNGEADVILDPGSTLRGAHFDSCWWEFTSTDGMVRINGTSSGIAGYSWKFTNCLFDGSNNPNRHVINNTLGLGSNGAVQNITFESCQFVNLGGGKILKVAQVIQTGSADAGYFDPAFINCKGSAGPNSLEGIHVSLTGGHSVMFFGANGPGPSDLAASYAGIVPYYVATLADGVRHPSSSLRSNAALEAPLWDKGGQVHNVMAYLARGDGVADDTAAIQSAVNAMAATGGTLYFPPGTYLVSSPGIVLPGAPAGEQRWLISGYGATIKATTAIAMMKRDFPTDMTNATNYMLRKFTIEGLSFLGNSTTGQVGLDMLCTFGMALRDLYFENCDTGMRVTFGLNTVIDTCREKTCKTYGFRLRSGNGLWSGATQANSPSNASTFRDCRSYGATGATAQFSIEGASGVMLDGVITEGNNPVNAVVHDDQGSTTCKFFTIRNHHSENTPTNAVIRTTPMGVVLIEALWHQTNCLMVDATGANSAAIVYVDKCPWTPATPAFKAAGSANELWVFTYLGSSGVDDPTASARWSGGTVPRMHTYGATPSAPQTLFLRSSVRVGSLGIPTMTGVGIFNEGAAHGAVLYSNAGSNYAIKWGTAGDDPFSAAKGGVLGDGTVILTKTGKTALQLTDTSTTTGLTIGADTNLYRSAANELKTDDEFRIGINGGKDTLALTDTTVDVGITIGGDTNLYRSAADTLKTDDSLVVGAGNLTLNDTVISRTDPNQIGGSVVTARFLEIRSYNDRISMEEANSKGQLDIYGAGTTTDQAAPAADFARLFVKDNGAGKDQLVVRFNTGAVQVLATEP